MLEPLKHPAVEESKLAVLTSLVLPGSLPPIGDLLASLKRVSLLQSPSACIRGSGSSYQGMPIQAVNSGLPGYVNGQVIEQSDFYPAMSVELHPKARSVSDIGSILPDFDVTYEWTPDGPGRGIQFAVGEGEGLIAIRSEARSQCHKTMQRSKHQRRYRQTPAGRAACLRYQQSSAGKESRRKYQRSAGGRAMHRAAQFRYAKSPQGREKRRVAGAIRRTRICAYNKELVRSHDENLAKQKGEEAAARKKMELEQVHALTKTKFEAQASPARPRLISQCH